MMFPQYSQITIVVQELSYFTILSIAESDTAPFPPTIITLLTVESITKSLANSVFLSLTSMIGAEFSIARGPPVNPSGKSAPEAITNVELPLGKNFSATAFEVSYLI